MLPCVLCSRGSSEICARVKSDTAIVARPACRGLSNHYPRHLELDVAYRTTPEPENTVSPIRHPTHFGQAGPIG